jgi:hypothetical protein
MAMHTAQSISRNPDDGDGDDGGGGGQTGLQFNHAETASAIRAALRPGEF